jgi:2-dehydropantoate 2-reductase
MKLAIIGDGAMGCLLAWSLAPHCDLGLLSSWPEHAALLAQHGIGYERNGAVEHRAVRVATNPEQLAGRDAAIVMVKSHQTPWAAHMAQQLLVPDGLAVTLQNGLGNREQLAAVLGEARVGQGATSLGATLVQPGLVRHGGSGTTVFGAPPQPQRAAQLAALFTQAGLPAEVSPAVERVVWGKLVVNCGINALSALLRVPNGALAEQQGARALLAAAVDEAARVAQAKGVALPYHDPLAHTLAVARATGTNYSSMLQDVLRGRPTEIASINGALAAEATRLGIDAPVNRLLAQLVAALEATAALRV